MQVLVNDQWINVPVDWQEETLLHVLREALGLVGTKFGCGLGQCGACTVLLDGEPVRSCQMQIAMVGTRSVTTIEGIEQAGRLHPVQQAWLSVAVPQCGYCQAGQIMTAVALLRRVPQPSDEAIDSALAGNLCRCGTQQRIRQAVKRAAGLAP